MQAVLPSSTQVHPKLYAREWFFLKKIENHNQGSTHQNQFVLEPGGSVRRAPSGVWIPDQNDPK